MPVGLPLQTFLLTARGILTLKTHRHAQSSYIVTEYSKRYDTGYAVLYYDEGGGVDLNLSINSTGVETFINFVKDLHITFICKRRYKCSFPGEKMH